MESSLPCKDEGGSMLGMVGEELFELKEEQVKHTIQRNC